MMYADHQRTVTEYWTSKFEYYAPVYETDKARCSPSGEVRVEGKLLFSVLGGPPVEENSGQMCTLLYLLSSLVMVISEELILVQTKGLDQAHKLGLSLRRRYVDNGFLDARYLPSEVVFRSSAVERCLMTASATASSMFNLTENGHPTAVPIFTVPKEKDDICRARIQCPFVVDEMKQITDITDQSVDLQRILDELFAQEAKRLNFTHIVERDRIRQFEPIFFEHDSGLAVPQWFNDDARKEANHLLDLTIEFISGTGRFHSPKWILTRSGKLLYTILNNQRKAVEDALNGTKFFGFTTHDVLISPLLDSMGVLNVALAPKGRPDFVATVVFELWKNDTQHYVKVLYRRNTESNEFTNLTPMIKSCGGGNACEIKVFEEAVRTFQTEHPEVLCNKLNIKQDSDRNSGIPGEHLLGLIYGKPMKIGYHLILASSL
ncbi:unnamed protein product [Angiostrongylus costaricensis]|uniref:acid phosphatase n=1 Tax=Angiostrongylus costaricensis TaxID=334426 RepID=A0A158PMK5_ANGCS|nr:unnamed protein product [Angiostrongylus costaricensis]